MSVAEIKQQIEHLSSDEREEIELFLRAKRLSDSPEYRARVARAHQQIDAGRCLNLDHLKEQIEKNQAARRAS